MAVKKFLHIEMIIYSFEHNSTTLNKNKQNITNCFGRIKSLLLSLPMKNIGIVCCGTICSLNKALFPN